jgi:hypothetical protein
MEKGDYKINNIYEPGYAKFHPSKDIPTINYKIPSGQIGMATDPRMANQLQELSTKLNAGTVPIEVGALVNQETFDKTPIQHFTEMKRKAKLAEAKVSLHAPVDGDPSGFSREGWDESNRIQVERQLMTVMDKAYLLDDKENVPVTMHGSAGSASTWTFVKDPKTGERKKVSEMMVAVDRETGQLAPLKEESIYFPGGKVEEKKRRPEQKLINLNQTKWEDEVLASEFQRENAEKVLARSSPIFIARYADLMTGRSKGYNSEEEKEQIEKIHFAAEHIQESARKANNNFSKAYELAMKDKSQEQLNFLDELSKEYGKILGEDLKDEKERMHRMVNPKLQSQALSLLNKGLRQIQPNLFQSVEDFSVNKASETFSNVALHSYEKYKDKSPIVSIENLYPGMGFSQAKDLKNLIKKSRERFVEKAITKGMSESQAKSAAEKIIGATFDIGHLNINKKFGFTDEDLAKEAKEISKFVKHVHLTDNFGYSDSHLPLGMGNVPVKEIMENLGEAGSKARKINEVGGWFEHFKTNPFSQILEAAGSPIYSSGEGPYWSHKTGFQQSYMEGYGMMLPQTHYEQFGAGFSRLPSSLGGSTQQGTGGAGGRMGGGRE